MNRSSGRYDTVSIDEGDYIKRTLVEVQLLLGKLVGERREAVNGRRCERYNR